MEPECNMHAIPLCLLTYVPVNDTPIRSHSHPCQYDHYQQININNNNNAKFITTHK